MKKALVIVLFFVCLIALGCNAKTTSTSIETPTNTLKAYYNALNTKNYDKAYSFWKPEAIKDGSKDIWIKNINQNVYTNIKFGKEVINGNNGTVELFWSGLTYTCDLELKKGKWRIVGLWEGLNPKTVDVNGKRYTAHEIADLICLGTNESLPKVNCTITVPSEAKSGEKITIKLDIENLDEKKTINNISITTDLFPMDALINYHSKDSQLNLIWSKNNLIPPKHKRTFEIEAVASRTGKYSGAIYILTIENRAVYSLNSLTPLDYNLTIY